MIYIIVGYVILAALLIFLYYRFSEFRVNSANEARSLSEKYESQISDLRQSSEQVGQESKHSSEKMQDLLEQINHLRQEKENELAKRLEAEKQIELTILRTKEIEKRMHDWSEAQDAAMRDCMNAVLESGDNLYEKLNQSYKLENNVVKDQILSALTGANSVNETSPQNISNNKIANNPLDKVVNQVLSEIKSFEIIDESQIFTPANFDPKIAPLMLSEIAFIHQDKLQLMDFKLLRYFAEYQNLQNKDQDLASKTLEQRLNKYFSYISHAKYQKSVLKALESKSIIPSQVKLAIFVGSNSQLLEEFGFAEKFANLDIKIIDENSVLKLI